MKKTVLFLLLLFCGFVEASPFVKPSEPSGILYLASNHQSKDIYPVSIFEVDGKKTLKRDNAVWLAPGKHTIRVSSRINFTTRSALITKRQNNKNQKRNNTLEVNIEGGKTYYVGYDASNRDPSMWHPVVWKVK